MKARDWGLLLLLSLLWGGAFYFYKTLDDAGVPPFSIVLARVALAALALLPVVWLWRLAMPSSPGGWLRYVPLAAANNVIPFVLISWGETHISSGLASILNATTPIFTAIVAHQATSDERFSAKKIAGIALGFAGIVALVGPDAFAGLNFASLAQLACLGAAISYAFAGVYGKRFRGTPPIVVATSQLVASTLLLLPLEVVVDKPWTFAPLPAFVWLSLGAMAVLGTSAAYIIYFRLIAEAGAVNASLVTLLIPPVALVLGGVFLHERLSLGMLLGMGLIFAGLAALDGRIFRAFRRASARMGLRTG